LDQVGPGYISLIHVRTC